MRLLAVPAGLSHAELLERLEQLFQQGETADWPPRGWPSQQILATAVGPQHIAVLFEGGVVGRVGYEVAPGSVEPPAARPTASASGRDGSASDSSLWGSSARLRPSMRRSDGRDGGASSLSWSSGDHPRTMALHERMMEARAEARASAMQGFHTRRQYSVRMSGGGVAASQPVPASAVPDELVVRVAEVLPGKSRATIIRQLQRAGLDVDAAIGMLLSTEEDEEEAEMAHDPSGSSAPTAEDATRAAEEHLMDEDDMADIGGIPSLHYRRIVMPPSASSASAQLAAAQRYLAEMQADEAMSSGSSDDEHEYHHDADEFSDFVTEITRRRNAASGDAATVGSASSTDVSSTTTGSASTATTTTTTGAGASAAPTSRSAMAADLFFEIDEDGDAGSFGMPPVLRALRKRQMSQGDEAETTGHQSSSSSSSKSRRVAGKPSAVTLAAKIELVRGPLRFCKIASTHTELLLVEDGTNALWRWRWSDPSSAISVSPHSERLELAGRRVAHLVACPTRAVVATADGAVAVVTDACVRLGDADSTDSSTSSHVASSFSLDRSAVVYNVFVADPITQLDASASMCCAVTEGGRAYWWGIPPVAARSAMLASHGKLRKTRFQSRCIKPGDTVYLKTAPVFRPGCIGINPRGGKPAVGRLLDTAWSLTDKCRFELLGGVGSTGGAVGSAGGSKDPVVEEWRLEEVLLEPGGMLAQKARVLKVDGAHAAVFFEADATSDGAALDDKFMWEHSRLMGVDELCTISDGDADGTRTVPDFEQRVPLALPTTGRVMAAAVVANGTLRVLSLVVNDRVGDGDVVQCVDFGWGADGNVTALRCTHLPGDAATRGLHHLAFASRGGLTTLNIPLSDDGALQPQVVPHGVSGVSNDEMQRYFGIPALLGAASGVCSAQITKGGSHVPVRTSSGAASLSSSSSVAASSVGAIEVLALLPRPARLVPCVLALDEPSFFKVLEDGQKHMYEAFASERADGSRNVLHTLVAVAERRATASTSEGLQRFDALKCLKAVLEKCHDPHHAHALLSHVDALGRTPLIAALEASSWDVAQVLLDRIMSVSTNVPTGVGDSATVRGASGSTTATPRTPRFVWRHLATGVTVLELTSAQPACTSLLSGGGSAPEQPAFECLTCRSAGSAPVVCAPCARTAHLGHDVRHTGFASFRCADGSRARVRGRKLASPTSAHTKVTEALLQIPEAAAAVNFDGETAVHRMVLEIVGRKTVAASARPQDSTSQARRLLSETTRVLLELVGKWDVVAATVLVGTVQQRGGAATGPVPDGGAGVSDDQHPSTTQLDGLVFRLLSGDLKDVLAKLLETMRKALESTEDSARAEAVVTRFVRSSTRVYTVLASGSVASELSVVVVGSAPSAPGMGSSRRGDSGSNSGSGDGAPRPGAEYAYDSPLLVQCR